MKYLLDTNILLRLVELAHAQHKEAREALKTLRRQNCVFYILLQNVSEFWNVCTRPKDKNGLGLSITQADLYLKRLERFFTLLPDTEAVYRKLARAGSQSFSFWRKSPRRENRRRDESPQHSKSADLQHQIVQPSRFQQSQRT